MRSSAGFVHQCHGPAVCGFHSTGGWLALPCSPVPEASLSYRLPSDKPFTLDDQTLAFRAHLVRSALLRTNQDFAQAAGLLGITRQGLSFIIDGQLKDYNLRAKPKQTRRRSIVRAPK